MAVDYIGNFNDGLPIDIAITQAKTDSASFTPVKGELIDGNRVRLTDATGAQLFYKYSGKGTNKMVAFTPAQR